jgi:hypothetical protein
MDVRIPVNIDGVETESVSGGGHSGGGIFYKCFRSSSLLDYCFFAKRKWKKPTSTSKM